MACLRVPMRTLIKSGVGSTSARAHIRCLATTHSAQGMDRQTHMTTVPDRLVLDGGMGTEVIKIVGKHQNKDPIWSSKMLLNDDGVEIIKRVHREFLSHGADVIMTNTYKPSVENFMDHVGLSRDDSLEVFRKACRVAREVRDEFWAQIQVEDPGRCRPLVAAAQSPYGGRTFTASEYTGTYVETTSIEEMKEGHRHKTRALIEGGVDIIAFETVPAAIEGQLIAEMMQEFPGSKAWVAFSCKDGKHTCHGEAFSDAVMTSLLSDQVVAVGINCSKPEFVTSLLQQIPDEVREKKKIVIYPNSGEVWDKIEKFWYFEDDSKSAKPLHEYVPEWIQHGADWIGGCCNVTPRDITQIRDAMTRSTSS